MKTTRPGVLDTERKLMLKNLESKPKQYEMVIILIIKLSVLEVTLWNHQDGNNNDDNNNDDNSIIR